MLRGSSERQNHHHVRVLHGNYCGLIFPIVRPRLRVRVRTDSTSTVRSVPRALHGYHVTLPQTPVVK